MRSCVALLVVLATAPVPMGCKKEPPPSEGPKDGAAFESLQVSDLDFNPSLPVRPSGGAAAAPAGSGSAAAPPAGSASAEAAAAGGAPAVTLKQPGSDPKEPLRYAFETGKPDTVVATFKTAVRQEMGGAGQAAPAQPPVRFTFNVVGTEKKGTATRFSLKVANAELLTKGMSLPPQAEAQIAAVTKAMQQIAATFRVDATGTLQELEFSTGSPGASRVTGEMLPMVQQALEMLFLVLPQEPIGLGGQWATVSSATEGNGPGSMTSTYTLKERTKTGALVHVDVEKTMPTQPLPDPSAPPGSTVEMKGKSSYDVQLRFAGPATKANGDAETRVTMKDGSTQPPRAVVQIAKVSQTLETKPGAPPP